MGKAAQIAYKDIPSVVGGYYGAMRRRLDGLGVKFWANVESFGGKPRRPTEIVRLGRQLETAGGHVAPEE